MATVRSSSKTTTTTKSPKSPVSPTGAGTTSSITSPSSTKNQVLGGLNEGGGGQEDIATIAKQISDHAEAIYQTWKARGLAPTEILNCHATTPTNDTFGKAFKSNQNNKQSPGSKYNNKDSPVTELIVNAPDMSNNNLEKLVNTFVNEDKARLAARKRNSNSSPIGGSTIQHALKKFEKSDTSPVKQLSPSSLGNTSSLNNKNNVNDVLINSIDQVLPKTEITSVRNNSSSSSSSSNNSSSISKSSSPNPSPQKPQTPAKPANLINHVPSWPLKNRLGTSPNSSSNSSSSSPISNSLRNSKEPSPTKDILDSSSNQRTTNPTTTTTSPTSTTSLKSPSSTVSSTSPLKSTTASRKSSDLLDEVSREEERLINALKATTLITNNDTNLTENLTNWKKPEVSTTTSSPNTVTATWNGIQLKPVTSVPSTNSTTNFSHQRIDEMHQNNNNNSYIKTKGPRAPRTENVPHPELSASRNLNIRSTSASPVRPFLTRGSVAERVLIFERCPEIKVPPRNAVKEPIKLQAKPYIKPLPSHTTLQRHIKNSTKNVYIPRFHYPNGKPLPAITIETTLQRIQAEFNSFPNYKVSRENFHHIVTACGVPLYWRTPLFFCTPLTQDNMVDGYRFVEFWKQMTSDCNDAASRFVYILTGRQKRSFLLPEDFAPLIQDVVDTHPGLTFLKEAAEFHSRYVHTVIARIFYSVNRSWTGKISVQEIRRANLLQIIQLLEEEEDINQITQYFSYEHFYVIYCKFWELDRDHDLQIDQNDLARHNEGALSSRMIERIFTNGVTKKIKIASQQLTQNKMSYSEFVYFLLAEEDKSHPAAIEYWFRCMDIDGDGILSMHELQYFYEEQQQRMEALGIEILPFADCVCQMLDMIKPMRHGCITLGDLKRCKMTPIFFDTFFNFEKYMENEQRDPFASQRDGDEMSDWDRYAAMEYEYLVSEESGDTQGSGDEEIDYESNIDILECESQIDEW